MTEVPAPNVGRPTTEAGVDRVLDLLSGIDRAPVAEHPPVYAAVHDELRRALELG